MKEGKAGGRIYRIRERERRGKETRRKKVRRNSNKHEGDEGYFLSFQISTLH